MTLNVDIPITIPGDSAGYRDQHIVHYIENYIGISEQKAVPSKKIICRFLLIHSRDKFCSYRVTKRLQKVHPIVQYWTIRTSISLKNIKQAKQIFRLSLSDS